MSRRPGSHLLYEDKIKPCLRCGGSGRVSIRYCDREAAIECTKCHAYFFAMFRKGVPYEDIRKKLIEHWNNDENWEPKQEE